jgi:DNA-binding response OmpR family regulator
MAWRVLVAEKDPELSALITKTLSPPLFEVLVCPDAESALVSLRRAKPYDVLISEWSLPGMSGLELIGAVRSLRDFATLPILIIGDHIRYDMESIVERAGANKFLGKPIASEPLHAAVRTLAAKFRPLSAAEQAAVNAKAAVKPGDPLDDPSPSSVIRIPTAEMLAELKRRRPQR